jgi:hypothetical protein
MKPSIRSCPERQATQPPRLPGEHSCSRGRGLAWPGAGRSRVARCFCEGPARPPRSLFDPLHYEDSEDPASVEVQLQGVCFERLRDSGEVWWAWGLWRLPGLGTLLAAKMPAGRAEIRWATVAVILTIARFCTASSKLHIEDHGYVRTWLWRVCGRMPHITTANVRRPNETRRPSPPISNVTSSRRHDSLPERRGVIPPAWFSRSRHALSPPIPQMTVADSPPFQTHQTRSKPPAPSPLSHTCPLPKTLSRRIWSTQGGPMAA